MKKIICSGLSILLILFPIWSFAQKPAVTEPIPVNQLQGFNAYPEPVQKLIKQAQKLSQLNLTYLFGSADPERHGMDCSGTIYYLLRQMGVDSLPRSANEQYLWAQKNGNFYSVSQNEQLLDFSQLKPGDLLFWSGTYDAGNKNQITHVMIYLGKDNQNRPLMFGSSDGRTYGGRSMWGVSVFDFNLPRPGASSHFVGYSCIPGLTCFPH